MNRFANPEQPPPSRLKLAVQTATHEYARVQSLPGFSLIERRAALVQKAEISMDVYANSGHSDTCRGFLEHELVAVLLALGRSEWHHAEPLVRKFGLTDMFEPPRSPFESPGSPEHPDGLQQDNFITKNEPIFRTLAITFALLLCLFPPWLLDAGSRGKVARGHQFLLIPPANCTVDGSRFLVTASIPALLAALGWSRRCRP